MSFVTLYCPNCKKKVRAKAEAGFMWVKAVVCPRCGRKL